MLMFVDVNYYVLNMIVLLNCSLQQLYSPYKVKINHTTGSNIVFILLLYSAIVIYFRRTILLTLTTRCDSKSCEDTTIHDDELLSYKLHNERYFF